MIAAVHVTIHKELHIAIIVHIYQLNLVFLMQPLRTALTVLTEGEEQHGLPLLLGIAPEIAANREYTIGAARRLHCGHIGFLHHAEFNTILRKGTYRSFKFLAHRALIIHQIETQA